MQAAAGRSDASRSLSRPPSPNPREERAALRDSAQVVPFQLLVEGSQPDAELCGSEPPVATDGRQRALDRLSFQLRERSVVPVSGKGTRRGPRRFTKPQLLPLSHPSPPPDHFPP